MTGRDVRLAAAPSMAEPITTNGSRRAAGATPAAGSAPPAGHPAQPTREPTRVARPRTRRGVRTLRLVHLFPDLLNVYGDAGNVRTLTVRAEVRGIRVEVAQVRAGCREIPAADVLLIGGGQDREQRAVARELELHGPAIRDRIVDGAALLAVCGGFQNLGWSYRTAAGETIDGPGILDVRTEAGSERMVGPVLAAIRGGPGAWSGRDEVVGFENHAGRTWLGPAAQPFAIVEIGHGNNGSDGTEGILALPGEGAAGGLRIGTYLHGPLLPRNPHVADALIAAGLAHGGPAVALEPLRDEEEWQAHDGYAARSRGRRRNEQRLPRSIRRFVTPIRSLVGF